MTGIVLIDRGALGLTRQQAAEAVASGLALAHVDVGGQKRIMQDAAPDALPIEPALQDDLNVEVGELGRVQIPVGAADGYLLVSGQRNPLPVGSSFRIVVQSIPMAE